MCTVRTRSVDATRSRVATGYGVCVLPEVLFRAGSHDGERLVAAALSEDIPALGRLPGTGRRPGAGAPRLNRRTASA
jgi:hypothetical protein